MQAVVISDGGDIIWPFGGMANWRKGFATRLNAPRIRLSLGVFNFDYGFMRLRPCCIRSCRQMQAFPKSATVENYNTTSFNLASPAEIVGSMQ